MSFFFYTEPCKGIRETQHEHAVERTMEMLKEETLTCVNEQTVFWNLISLREDIIVQAKNTDIPILALSLFSIYCCVLL